MAAESATGAVVVVGTHWGDEAKGKFVDLIGQAPGAVGREEGGPLGLRDARFGDEGCAFGGHPGRLDRPGPPRNL